MYYLLAIGCLGLNVYITLMREKKRRREGASFRRNILPDVLVQIGYLIAVDRIFPFFGPDVDNSEFLIRFGAAFMVYLAGTVLTMLLYRRLSGSGPQ